MREHLAGFCRHGEDVFQPANRVNLDQAVRDVFGLPVARTTYRPHRHELVASAHHAARLEAVLREAGAHWTHSHMSPRRGAATLATPAKMSAVPASRHVVGTARMGIDPATSVGDPWGRLHDLPNVTIGDSSLSSTSSGYGPTLTLVAPALRNARALVGGG